MCCLPIKIHSLGCMVHDDADWHFRHFRHLFTFNQKYCQNNIFPLMCNLIQIEKDIFCFDQIQNLYSCGTGLNSVELSLLLAPPLGMNSLLHSACCPGTTCPLSASFLIKTLNFFLWP